jgi:hypothetical protein
LINLPWKWISKFDEELFNVEHLASQLCLLSSNWKDCVRFSIVSLSIYNKEWKEKQIFHIYLLFLLFFFYSVIPKDKNSPISTISSPLSSLPSYHLSTHIHKKKLEITILACMLARATIGLEWPIRQRQRRAIIDRSCRSHLSNVLIVVVLSAIFQSFVCTRTHTEHEYVLWRR